MAETSTAAPIQTGIREPFNALTHAAGAVLMLTGTIWLGTLVPTPFMLLAVVVYGLSVTATMASSATYHWSWKNLDLLRRVDHFCIGLGIWGTYAGIFAAMGGPIARVTFGIECLGLFILCVAALKGEVSSKVRLPLFAIMGWISVFILPAMNVALGPATVAWVLAGGAVYTIGMVVYAVQKPNPWSPQVGFHGLWHLFVLGGAGCHFVAVLTAIRHTIGTT